MKFQSFYVLKNWLCRVYFVNICSTKYKKNRKKKKQTFGNWKPEATIIATYVILCDCVDHFLIIYVELNIKRKGRKGKNI